MVRTSFLALYIFYFSTTLPSSFFFSLSCSMSRRLPFFFNSLLFLSHTLQPTPSTLTAQLRPLDLRRAHPDAPGHLQGRRHRDAPRLGEEGGHVGDDGGGSFGFGFGFGRDGFGFGGRQRQRRRQRRRRRPKQQQRWQTLNCHALSKMLTSQSSIQPTLLKSTSFQHAMHYL